MDPVSVNGNKPPPVGSPSDNATQYMSGDAVIAEPPRLPELALPTPAHNRTMAIAPPPGYKEHPPPTPTGGSAAWILVTAIGGLGAIAILGFVWPGFLRSAETDGRAASAGDGGSLVATSRADASAGDALVVRRPLDAGQPSADSTPSMPIDASIPMAVISLESKPSGATVTDAKGKVLGKTPLTVSLKRSEKPAVFHLSHLRTQKRKSSVVPSGDKRLLVELVVKRRGGGRGTKRDPNKNPDRTLKPF